MVLMLAGVEHNMIYRLLKVELCKVQCIYIQKAKMYDSKYYGHTDSILT